MTGWWCRNGRFNGSLRPSSVRAAVGGVTVRVADGEPGHELQIDFARLGLLDDPDSGRRRVCHALIFTAVLSRHMFVWLSFTQTTDAVIAGCEAAWRFFGGVFKVLIPANLTPVVAEADWRTSGPMLQAGDTVLLRSAAGAGEENQTPVFSLGSRRNAELASWDGLRGLLRS